jgi:D-alanyl-lipoteichoic acid acyltransferase DltB (MBOAT superfamily)
VLFSSFEFILVFWPVALLVYALLRRTTPRAVGLVWLVAASLAFYGWWSTRDLALIVASMATNYLLARALGPDRPSSRAWLTAGVALNLAALAWFKYAGFLADNVGTLLARELELPATELPLAISFFTFQQIAYLVDAHRGQARDYGPLEYTLFVTFFPQLIAGPIVHHGEIIPQFRDPRPQRSVIDALTSGVFVFALGLFKKAVLADGLAHWSAEGFGAAASGAPIDLVLAWKGALAYTFQLYFDFSGYADMAIGIGRTFGIELPANFESPYKSPNMVEFWRRWHMTLSRFLRDYLYIPLGGNRGGPAQRERNLMITMLLGGLWHGAGWQFVIWGGLHGLYLVVTHRVQQWRKGRDRGAVGGMPRSMPSLVERGAGVMLTFLLVVVAWVFFRAPDVPSAARMLSGMFGLNGLSTVPLDQIWDVATTFVFALCFAIVWGAPSVAELEQWAFPARLGRRPRNPALLGLAVGLLLASSFVTLNEVGEFLYFQF